MPDEVPMKGYEGASVHPYSGNLDRIQIIKGWLNEDGETEEKVYDVVWSDDRKPGPDGKLTQRRWTEHHAYRH